jgi:hypothetical protein
MAAIFRNVMEEQGYYFKEIGYAGKSYINKMHFSVCFLTQFINRLIILFTPPKAQL